MKTVNLWKWAASFVVAMAILSLRTEAAAPGLQSDEHDLSHFVHFEVGATYLRGGDKITIDEIHGTSDTIAVGNLYEIKGTYSLASHSNAQIAVEVTSSDPRHFPTMSTQYMAVDKGDGHFTVYLYMWDAGNPHMSFYPTGGGESFASVYFGTGESVLKHMAWRDDVAG